MSDASLINRPILSKCACVYNWLKLTIGYLWLLTSSLFWIWLFYFFFFICETVYSFYICVPCGTYCKYQCICNLKLSIILCLWHNLCYISTLLAFNSWIHIGYVTQEIFFNKLNLCYMYLIIGILPCILFHNCYLNS